MAIEIISFKYFGEDSESTEWNARVVYKKNNKSYNCILFVDYYKKELFIPKKIQFNECKVLSGIEQAIKIFLKF